MTQEDKELLLKDLCARLPYGVKAILSEYHIDEFPYNGTYCNKIINLGICGDTINLLNHIEKYGIKPYLRPMSSMTKEEKKEFAKVMVISQDCSYQNNESATTMVNDWYLSKGFDVRGLIPKGLALEAPEGMYDIKEK